MKSVAYIFLVLIVSFLHCNGQNMTVYDLYTAQASTDIKVIGNFLTNSKSFQFVDSYTEKSDPDWISEVYIFSNNKNVIRISINSGYSEGKFMTFTSLVYKIYTKEEYNYFLNSLIKFGFSIYDVIESKDGRKQTIWTAPKPEIKLINIMNEENYYKIQII